MGAFAGSRKVRPGPARGVILSKDRARKASKRAGGGKLRGAWEIRFDVKRELAYDLDMRKIIDHVRLVVMEHYREFTLAGRHPSGRRHPKRTEETRKRHGGGTAMGVLSGYMANHWWSGKIRGGPFRSFVLIKPYGGADGPTPRHVGPGRAIVIRRLLRQGVDFQGTTGAARKVFQAGFDEAISDGFGDVKTPARARTREGLLPQLRGGT